MPETVELINGGSRALISTEGQALIGLSLDGVAVMPDSNNAQAFFAGKVLAPWPNRIRGGNYRFASRDFHIEGNDGLGNALHGLIFDKDSSISHQDVSSVTLSTTLLGSPQYPGRLEIQTTYSLETDSLTVTHGAKNIGELQAPVGLGAHPYFAVPKDAKLLVKAGRTGRRESDMIPEIYEEIQSLGLSPNAATHIDSLELDNEFTDLFLEGGVAQTLVIDSQGNGFAVWQEAADYLMIYTCDEFPFDAGVAPAIAIEPQTCGANAFNNGRGLTLLESGEEVGFRWGVRLLFGDEGNL